MRASTTETRKRFSARAFLDAIEARDGIILGEKNEKGRGSVLRAVLRGIFVKPKQSIILGILLAVSMFYLILVLFSALLIDESDFPYDEADFSENGLRVAIISTYPPYPCGIGTFTQQMISGFHALNNETGVTLKDRINVHVIALDKSRDNIEYDKNIVKYRINVHKGEKQYIKAAKYINSRRYDLLILQHEYGLIPHLGWEYTKLIQNLENRCSYYDDSATAAAAAANNNNNNGSNSNSNSSSSSSNNNNGRKRCLRIYTVLHTPRRYPRIIEMDIVRQLSQCSDRVVVLSERSIQDLEGGYGISNRNGEKITYIPHGVPNFPNDDAENTLSTRYKEELGLSPSSKVIMTFGLLHRKKGVQYMIDAMKDIVDRHPNALYVLLGQFNPDEQEMVQLRNRIKATIAQFHLEDNIKFVESFVDDETLMKWMMATDVYVTPYLEYTPVSGTITYAMALGRPVVSTAYRYAVEMLGQDRGILVRKRNSTELARAVNALLDDPDLALRLRNNAYDYTRRMLWPEVIRTLLNTLEADMSGYNRSRSRSRSRSRNSGHENQQQNQQKVGGGGGGTTTITTTASSSSSSSSSLSTFMSRPPPYTAQATSQSFVAFDGSTIPFGALKTGSIYNMFSLHNIVVDGEVMCTSSHACALTQLGVMTPEVQLWLYNDLTLKAHSESHMRQALNLWRGGSYELGETRVTVSEPEDKMKPRRSITVVVEIKGAMITLYLSLGGASLRGSLNLEITITDPFLAPRGLLGHRFIFTEDVECGEEVPPENCASTITPEQYEQKEMLSIRGQHILYWNHTADVCHRRREDSQQRQYGSNAISIHWNGPQFDKQGFATVNREICTRLVPNPQIDLWVTTSQETKRIYSPKNTPSIAALFAVSQDRSNPYTAGKAMDVTIRNGWPPNWQEPPKTGGHWVQVQPWEFGAIPREWVDTILDSVDDVWVPTEYVRRMYIRNGVPEDRVFVISHGVDMQAFNPLVPPTPFVTSKRFKFLFTGGLLPRKGIDILLRAYQSAFTAADDVVLIIHSVYGDEFFMEQIQEAVRAGEAKLGPEVIYLTSPVTVRELAGMYTAADAFVAPYRSEGFGLQIAEAMASGTPTIVTGAGAAMDFANADNAFLIPAHEEVPCTVLPCSKAGTPPKVFHWHTDEQPYWSEPIQEELAKIMRYVALGGPKAREESKRKAQLAYERITNEFTWDLVTDRVIERIRELRKRPIVRFTKTQDR